MINEKYNWVSALRGYAVLLVLLIHASQYLSTSNFTKNICNNGDLGVQFFFILSSFTLFTSYSKRKLVEGEFVNRNFFIRRFFRIAPYYYIAGSVYIIYQLFILDVPVEYFIEYVVCSLLLLLPKEEWGSLFKVVLQFYKRYQHHYRPLYHLEYFIYSSIKILHGYSNCT